MRFRSGFLVRNEGQALHDTIGAVIGSNVAMDTLQNIEPLLDAKDVKRLLRCSLPLVYKLAARNQLPCVRIPCPGEGTGRQKSMVRFKKADVLSFIDKHYQSSDYESGKANNIPLTLAT